MKLFYSRLSSGLLVLAIAAAALPAAALDVNGPDLNPDPNPSPNFDTPNELAAPDLPGPQPGGNNPTVGGGDAGGRSVASNPCPGGELIVSFDMDPDGHPIPTSFERECVLFR